MSRRIKKLEYLGGYKLSLQFDDKSVKIVDLKDMLSDAKNMLLPLIDIEYFKKVSCDGITICWPNGVDLCPDALYEMGKNIPKPIKKSRKKSPKLKTRKKPKSYA